MIIKLLLTMVSLLLKNLYTYIYLLDLPLLVNELQDKSHVIIGIENSILLKSTRYPRIEYIRYRYRILVLVSPMPIKHLKSFLT